MQYLACVNVECPAVDEVIVRYLRFVDAEARCGECGEIMEPVDYRAMETEPFRSRGVYA